MACCESIAAPNNIVRLGKKTRCSAAQQSRAHRHVQKLRAALHYLVKTLSFGRILLRLPVSQIHVVYLTAVVRLSRLQGLASIECYLEQSTAGMKLASPSNITPDLSIVRWAQTFLLLRHSKNIVDLHLMSAGPECRVKSLMLSHKLFIYSMHDCLCFVLHLSECCVF